MPSKFKKGGESRLSLEGLTGAKFRGKKIKAIFAHGERRRMRTVHYTDGSRENVSIADLTDALIQGKA